MIPSFKILCKNDEFLNFYYFQRIIHNLYYNNIEIFNFSDLKIQIF